MNPDALAAAVPALVAVIAPVFAGAGLALAVAYFAVTTMLQFTLG